MADLPSQPLKVADQRRIDKACVAFEAAWAGGGRPRLEDFLAPDAGAEVRTALLRELVLLDVHYRARAGESPSPADYQERFTDLDPAWLDDTAPACEASPPHASAPSGYELLGELGHGGMGVVYKARDLHVGRVVALKMIRAAQATPLEQARFQLEVDYAARVRHPNVVTVFGAGTHL